MDESDAVRGHGFGAGTGTGPNASDVSAGFLQAIQALNIQTDQPAMLVILTKLATDKVSTCSTLPSSLCCVASPSRSSPLQTKFLRVSCSTLAD